MKAAKAKGRLRGKEPKLNHRQEAHLVARFDGRDHGSAELADLFGVARSTVYRAVERERTRVGAGLGTGMRTDLTELSVSEARDHFSDAVNRAAFAGEITYVTRGRNQQRAAAIVPAELVEQYEAMIDLEDGRIAHERHETSRTVSRPAVTHLH